jgi:hypothetical protein
VHSYNTEIANRLAKNEYQHRQFDKDARKRKWKEDPHVWAERKAINIWEGYNALSDYDKAVVFHGCFEEMLLEDINIVPTADSTIDVDVMCKHPDEKIAFVYKAVRECAVAEPSNNIPLA